MTLNVCDGVKQIYPKKQKKDSVRISEAVGGRCSLKKLSLKISPTTVVIRLTNKRVQIVGSTNNLVLRSKKMRALVREKKVNSRSWPCELDKGCSL